MKALRLVPSILIVLSAVAEAMPARAQLDCPAGFLPLAESTPVTGAEAGCYRFEIPQASPFVRFDVETAQKVDLYFSEGLQSSLTDWDRVNATPVQGDAKFVLLNPSPGDYTVAVAPEAGPSAAFKLSATAGIPSGDDENLTTCTDDGVCTTALPMKMAPQAIQLGSAFGDRVIFPLTIPTPGKLTVTAHWSGSASRLALILNGPRRSEQANPVAAYARWDGALTYSVTAQDLEGGKRFQVSLVNFSGGEALGGLDIQTPRAFVFGYAKLAQVAVQGGGSNGAKGLHMPQGRIFEAKSPEAVCRDAVQGKIAWDDKGSTRWSTANVERLCKGTTRGAEPARCFDQVMRGGVDWGGGTHWAWSHALDLCAGTSDAARTIRCFRASIQRGVGWQAAIRTCSVR
jgi:hypothetical protein